MKANNLVKKSKKAYRVKKNIFLTVLIIAILMFVQVGEVTAKIYSNLPASVTTTEFPESYKPYIDELKRLHPNWIFKAVYTNLDWTETIRQETYELGESYSNNISTVHDSYGDEWKKNGQDNYVDGPYVTASVQGVRYVMDPRNYLTERGIFQFETLSYSNDITLAAIEKVLGSSPMTDPTYKNKYKSGGNWIDMGITYAEIIKAAGLKYDVSPIHIASRIVQETSGDIVNNRSINGSVSGYEGLYNFCNVGSTPNSNGTGAIENGLAYARNNGWTTPAKSIEGCTNLLRNDYIKWGQDTIYFQKFDVNNPGTAKGLYAYQYMTNIMAPYNESKTSYNAYSNANMLNETFEFHIPIYNNMPSLAATYPTIDTSSYYETDNTTVYLDDEVSNGVDLFNVRITADNSNSDNIVTVIREASEGADNRTIFTRIAKGVNTGWDKIRLTDGREVYVASQYVKVYVNNKVASITLPSTEYKMAKDTYVTITPNILPTTAINKNYTTTIANESIAKLENGKIKAVAVGETNITFTTVDGKMAATCLVKVIELSAENNAVFDTSLNVVAGKITKINPETKISTMKQKVTTLSNYTVEIKNIADKVLTDTENIGTGSKINIKNETGDVVSTYNAVIYGDISGDGIIDSLDILKIRKHLLGINILVGDLLKAANVSKDSENIVDSLDVLRLRKHLLGVITLEQ